MNNANQSSYRSIFKATSLFGGVQLYQIIISVIKSKIIAVLLGPYGVGIMGLLTSGLDLVKQITSLGLAQSAVRDVSEANATDNLDRITNTVSIVRKLVVLTGLLGLIGVLIFSPLLSYSAFGNLDYSLVFCILSITLLFDQLSVGQKVLLQGTRKLGYLAKSTAIGATLGLVICVPFYYFWGVNGIAPTIVLNSIVTLLLTWYYSRKLKINSIYVRIKDAVINGTPMLKLGIAMSISSVLASGSSFVLRSFIRSYGGEEMVGLYTAGFIIMTSYVGMVFTAMSTDYYPRLAAVSKDNKQSAIVINQQCEIGTLIIAPLLSLCVIFMPTIIELLYSQDFAGANNYILWSTIGIMLKMGGWCVAYQFVAKGESKLFMRIEIITNIYMLLLNMVGYYIAGLEGLGFSFSMGYLVYLLMVYIIAKKRYDFDFSFGCKKMYLLLFVLLTLCVVVKRLNIPIASLVVVCILTVVISIISFLGLNERMHLFGKIKA